LDGERVEVREEEQKAAKGLNVLKGRTRGQQKSKGGGGDEQ